MASLASWPSLDPSRRPLTYRFPKSSHFLSLEGTAWRASTFYRFLFSEPILVLASVAASLDPIWRRLKSAVIEEYLTAFFSRLLFLCSSPYLRSEVLGTFERRWVKCCMFPSFECCEYYVRATRHLVCRPFVSGVSQLRRIWCMALSWWNLMVSLHCYTYSLVVGKNDQIFGASTVCVHGSSNFSSKKIGRCLCCQYTPGLDLNYNSES